MHTHNICDPFIHYLFHISFCTQLEAQLASFLVDWLKSLFLKHLNPQYPCLFFGYRFLLTLLLHVEVLRDVPGNALGSCLYSCVQTPVTGKPLLLPVSLWLKKPKMARWQPHLSVQCICYCIPRWKHSSLGNKDLWSSKPQSWQDGKQNFCEWVIWYNSERSHSHLYPLIPKSLWSGSRGDSTI